MKISTLLEREPFVKIFEKTLASFLTARIGSPHTVEWLDSDVLNESSNSHQNWYCNPLINSIFVKGVDRTVFDSINGEYADNPMKPWRSKFQRLYLSLSQSPLFSIVLSRHKLRVSPAVESARSKLIIGGNTKLRLIDVAEKKVFVLLKDGFDQKYMSRELYVRTEFPFLPVPKVIDYSGNGTWYSEQYISGESPNRLSEVIGQKILLQAIGKIQLMLSETARATTVGEYADTLYGKIQGSLDLIPHIKLDVAQNIMKIASTLAASLADYRDQELTLAYCHGDFHQGNILSNEVDYWILDWEYSGEKQIVYDYLILLLESRIESGYSSRFLRLITSDLDAYNAEIAGAWPNINWQDNKNIYLTVFLLEELAFYIEENGNPLFYEKPDILEIRCNEFMKIVAGLFHN
ncbi:MAG: phosphotransferase [Porticoccaceae bacterium]|nr:phosphotransferase [Porticoccaceae bacterium]